MGPGAALDEGSDGRPPAGECPGGDHRHRRHVPRRLRFQAVPGARGRLVRVAGHRRRQAALRFRSDRPRAGRARRHLGGLEGPGDREGAPHLLPDHDRRQSGRGNRARPHASGDLTRGLAAMAGGGRRGRRQSPASHAGWAAGHLADQHGGQ